MSMSEKEPTSMHLDKTINIGQIITMGVMLVGIVAAYYSIRHDVNLIRALHDDRLTRLEASQNMQRETNSRLLDTLTAIKTDIAVMRTQMSRTDNESTRSTGSR